MVCIGTWMTFLTTPAISPANMSTRHFRGKVSFLKSLQHFSGPGSTLPFIHMNTSNTGVMGSYLNTSEQTKNCTPAYFFCHLPTGDHNYDIGNHKLLSPIRRIFKAEHTLIVWTDHKSLTYIQTAKHLNYCQATWVVFFFFCNFNFTLK